MFQSIVAVDSSVRLAILRIVTFVLFRDINVNVPISLNPLVVGDRTFRILHPQYRFLSPYRRRLS
jgi:hypothetical protein